MPIPGFLFAILLIVLFAGGSFLAAGSRYAASSPTDWRELAWPARIGDYFWHITLPIVALLVGGFAGLTMLTKNSFLEEINKQYVVTARAKGLTRRRVLYGHVFRNAMLLVIAGFPAAFIGILFTGALLIEVIFSLDGLGLLGFEAAINRDYPIMFGTLYIYTLRRASCSSLISDLTYVMVDPRIDFSSREIVTCRVGAALGRRLSPLTRRRLQNFRANRRGFWSLWIFLALFGVSLVRRADRQRPPAGRPVRRRGSTSRSCVTYPETTFGGAFPTEAEYRDPAVGALIREKGWLVWPPIRFRYDTDQLRPAGAGAGPAVAGELARDRRPGARSHARG